jgi:uncharacterized membrane protein
MSNWSFDILQQTGVWVWVCAAAAVVLGTYALAGRVWGRRRGWVVLGLIGIGIAGTALVLGIPAWRTPLGGLIWTFVVLSILSAVFYLNQEGHLGGRRMGVLLAMRIGALALLVPMLFEPVIRYIDRPKPEKPLLFLIDTSGSMSFPDVQNGPTRIQSVWQTLRPQLPKLREHFVPHFFTFSTDLHELKSPEALAGAQADGKATDVVEAIARVLQKTNRPDAEVVLISDGIDNVSANVVDAVRGSRRPIHTLSVGSPQAEPATLANIAVDNIEAGDDFVVGHASKVKATIKSTALANRVVDVKLAELDKSGKVVGPITSSSLVLQPLPEGQAVALDYKPRSVGVVRLAVWVDPVAGERSTVDNRQEFQGLALDPRMKVLYVEGRARPEYKSLNRALASDPNIEVASLLRIQADRFAAAGSVDGEPFKQMPNSLAQWKQFDVIILGDLDGSFLGKVQESAIEQAVLDGAGLLMIGGQNSFGPGGYQDTPIEKALPVFVGGLQAGQEKTQFVPELTASGLTSPIFEGLTDWFGAEGKKAGKALPALRGNVVVPRPKSGAQVLLIHADRPGPDGKPQIVLAVQRYGKGRSAAFTADTTYLWFLPMSGMGQESPYKTFWGQLVRWLAGEDVRNRQHGAGVEGLLNKNLYQLGESVRVRALVRDVKGDATRYAQVNLSLNKVAGGEEPGKKPGAPQAFPLAPSASRTGMYEVTIPTPAKGQYEASITATKDGKELGTQTLKFSVIAPAEEMLKIAANPAMMTQIASATNGFSYPLAQLPTLVDELIRNDKTTATARQEVIPLDNWVRSGMALTGNVPHWDKKYDLPMQGMLVIALLAGEWILRRRWQLP